MDSPFPGMDPYLEGDWADVHQSLVTYARDQLQGRLPADLRARTQTRLVIGGPADTPRAYIPDVGVLRQTGEGGPPRGGVAVAAEAEIETAQPFRVPLEAYRREGYVEIIEPGRGERVVTVIEVLSPSNKRPGRDRRDYLQKRRDCEEADLNFVEIDLLRAGEREPMADLERLPEDYRTPYLVAVRRGWGRNLMEFYRVPLRERLPAIAVPLRDTDRDVPLDLQPLITQTYRNGRYDFVDYRADPIPPLAAGDAAWADALLRAQGRR